MILEGNYHISIMVAFHSIYKKAYYPLVFFGALYVTAVYLATYPAVNRA